MTPSAHSHVQIAGNDDLRGVPVLPCAHERGIVDRPFHDVVGTCPAVDDVDIVLGEWPQSGRGSQSARRRCVDASVSKSAASRVPGPPPPLAQQPPPSTVPLAAQTPPAPSGPACSRAARTRSPGSARRHASRPPGPPLRQAAAGSRL